MPKPAAKMGRQPLAQTIKRLMNEAGKSIPDVVRRAAERGHPVPKSTLRGITDGLTKDPQLDSLEGIAAGLDMPRILFFAEILGVSPNDPGFKATQFAVYLEIYNSLTPAQKQKANLHIEGLLLQLQHIKSQPK